MTRYLEGLLARDRRVCVVWDESGHPFGAAWNALVHISDEQYTCLVDSGTVVAPSWDDLPIRILMADPKVGAVGCAGISQCWDSVGLNDACLLMGTQEAKACGPVDTVNLATRRYQIADLCARLRREGRKLAVLSGLTTPHPHRRRTGYLSAQENDGDGPYAADHLRFRKRWPYEPTRRRLIVRDTGNLGDSVCATPSVKAIRRAFPDYPLWIDARSPEVWLGNPDVDALCPEADEWCPGDFVLSLRRHTDHASPKHLIDLMAEEIQVPGYDGWEDLPRIASTDRIPRIYSKGGLREWAYGTSRHLGRFVVLCAEATWDIRCWPHTAQFVRLVRARFGCEVILLSSEAPAYRLGPYDWRAQTTINQAVAIVERATVVVTVDTGILHIAGTLGVPTVGLFGPTTAHNRLHAGQTAVSAGLECSGCFRLARGAYQLCSRDAAFSRPPRRFPDCMDMISAADAIRGVEKLWPTC